METLVNQVHKNATDLRGRLDVITSANLFLLPRVDNETVLPTAKVSYIYIIYIYVCSRY